MSRGNRKDRTMIVDEFEKCNRDIVDLLENKSPAEVETTGPETTNGIISNALSVKARDAASQSSRVVEILTKGERVKILDELNGYYMVRTSRGRIVYVSSKFISKGD